MNHENILVAYFAFSRQKYMVNISDKPFIEVSDFINGNTISNIRTVGRIPHVKIYSDIYRDPGSRRVVTEYSIVV